jgi:hypothetical protein
MQTTDISHKLQKYIKKYIYFFYKQNVFTNLCISVLLERKVISYNLDCLFPKLILQ